MSNSADVLPANVIEALQQGQTIEAIKRLREATGLGLKEAKEAIDAYNDVDKEASASSSAADALPASVLEALQAGNKLEAIKRLYKQGGHDLKQAKEAIDAYLEADSATLASMALNQPMAMLLAALQAGDKMLSIKLLREQTGLGLKEAKDAVEALPQQTDQKIEAIKRLYEQAQRDLIEGHGLAEAPTQAKNATTNYYPTIEKPRSVNLIGWLIGVLLLAYATYYLSQH
jgi:ribosomal protein L7/L12